MVQTFHQTQNSQLIYLLKSDFHKIDSLIRARDRIFEITICSKSFFFSKEQILLLSSKAFLYVQKTKKLFKIDSPPNVSEKLFLSCFQDIFSLFSSQSEIKISSQNVDSFHHLSQIFENSCLFLICENVLSTGEPQSFFLSSELFHHIPKNVFHSLNNFRILFNSCVIYCNRFFASLISNKIFNHILHFQKDHFIDFSNSPDTEIIKLFFDIFRGKSIWMNRSNQELISNVIHFLEFNSLAVFK
jgi:hypothetical protein